MLISLFACCGTVCECHAQVIFCARARTTFTGDLIRVEDKGVSHVVKALQVGGLGVHIRIHTLLVIGLPRYRGRSTVQWADHAMMARHRVMVFIHGWS